MITVNNSDLNLPTLGGMAIEFTEGLELDKNLYVYGIANGNGDYHYYLDPEITDDKGNNISSWLCEFLIGMGVSCVVAHNRNPKSRPAVGISYYMRSQNIDYATRVCVFILLAMHGYIKIPKKSEKRRMKNPKKIENNPIRPRLEGQLGNIRWDVPFAYAPEVENEEVDL